MALQIIGVFLVSLIANMQDFLGSSFIRSEERRVGKESRSRWSQYH